MEHHDGAVLTNRFAYVYQLAVLVRKNDRRDSFSGSQKKGLRSNLFLAKPDGPPQVRQAAESSLGNDRLGLHEKDRHH